MSMGEYLLLTRPRETQDGLPLLDVQALQDDFIAPLLALDTEGAATVERNIRYTHAVADGVAAVNQARRKPRSSCARPRCPRCSPSPPPAVACTKIYLFLSESAHRVGDV